MNFEGLGMDEPMDAPPFTMDTLGLMDDKEADDLFMSSASKEIFGDLDEFMEDAPEEDEIDSDPTMLVEDTFLRLVQMGTPKKILELTNMSLPSDIPQESRQQFYSLYYAALAENPAISAYPKIVALGYPLSTDQESGNLEIEFPNNEAILKFTDTVGSSLRKENRDTSPITSALMSGREGAMASSKKVVTEDDLRLRRKQNDPSDSLDFEVGDMDFSDQMIDSSQSIESMLTLDSGGGAFGQEVFKEAPKLEISLMDYSNKHIAEYLDTQFPTSSTEELQQILKDESLGSQRATEILAILRYIRTNRSLPNKVFANSIPKEMDIIGSDIFTR